MIALLMITAFFLGSLVPWQTAANGNLKEQMRSPLLASFINCTVGSIILTVIMFASGQSFYRPWEQLSAFPWYLWTSGPLGAVILVVAVVLLSRLGLIGTALSTMTGMIVSSLLFDHFGCFQIEVHKLDVLRLIGLILMILGVMIVLRLFSNLKAHQGKLNPAAVLWFMLGVVSGTLMTTQAAVNSIFRVELNSVVYCALISMASTSLLLLIIAPLVDQSPKRIADIKVNGRYWIFCGGLCGATNIMGYALLMNQLGAGTLITLGIAGQLCCSLMMDHFGLWGLKVRKANLSQLWGIMVIVGAIALIKF